MSAPVMYAHASDASARTMPTQSSAVPKRFAGMLSRSGSANDGSDSTFALRSVAMTPGVTVFTVTPFAAHSFAAVSMSDFCAAFVEA